MCSCGFDGVMVRPKRVHKQEIHIFPTYFAFQGSHEGAKESLQTFEPVTLGSLRGHFGATLEPLWVYGGNFSSLWDHYGMIVESLWVYEGPFSKNTYFPNKFQ